ncbi:MAG: hypothetical protein E7G59_03890 [Cutibacterium granulosum]|uniref:hypothetical protein n=1 Tax=Cutibacterium granulosum TaxID=33011 RepID=UPI002909A0AB|nr:hypothetical protein [Cutibacterium granulosum]MDU3821433.1 hypothetical protein [Cutibacterium granulosum]
MRSQLPQPSQEIVPAVSSTLPKPNLSANCIQELKDEGKLSLEIKKQLLIAGLSAKEAARLAPKIAAEVAVKIAAKPAPPQQSQAHQ